MNTDRFMKLKVFIEDTIEFFRIRLDGVDKDRYFADRDRRYILDKCSNK
ncbi:MAG: hypothetical protein N2738_05710 [Thermodesulfovibrionales bacterium]|nr:hypothetical protein [Thermodesulfovibrionales bacterium]